MLAKRGVLHEEFLWKWFFRKVLIFLNIFIYYDFFISQILFKLSAIEVRLWKRFLSSKSLKKANLRVSGIDSRLMWNQGDNHQCNTPCTTLWCRVVPSGASPFTSLLPRRLGDSGKAVVASPSSSRSVHFESPPGPTWHHRVFHRVLHWWLSPWFQFNLDLFKSVLWFCPFCGYYLLDYFRYFWSYYIWDPFWIL